MDLITLIQENPQKSQVQDDRLLKEKRAYNVVLPVDRFIIKERDILRDALEMKSRLEKCLL